MVRRKLPQRGGKTSPTTPRGKLLLDDKWLNEAEACIERLGRTCVEEHGTRPSLEDFRQLLRTVLAGRLEEWFADAQDIRVEDVTFKLGKIQQAPGKPRKCLPGDVFAFKLARGRYAFLRVMHVEPTEEMLVEVFGVFADIPDFAPTVAKGPRLFDYPVFVFDSEIIDSSRWTLVERNRSYEVSEDDKRLEFATLYRGKWAVITPLAPRSEPRRIPADELKQYGRTTIRQVGDLESDIKKAYRAEHR